MLEHQYNVSFNHPEYGDVTLSYGKNPLSKDWMYWSTIDHSMYATNKRSINTMVKNIKKKHPDCFEYQG